MSSVPAAFRTAAFQQQRPMGVVVGMGGLGPQAGFAPAQFPVFATDGLPPRVVGAVVPGIPVAAASIHTNMGKQPLFSLPSSAPLAKASSFSTGSKTRNPYYKKNPDHFSLRMNNIPHGISSNELWEAYEYKGIHTITDIYIPRGMDFGFLRFENETEGLAALPTKIVMNGVTIHLEIATGNKRSSAEMASVSPEELHAKQLQESWMKKAKEDKEGKKRDYEEEDAQREKTRDEDRAQREAMRAQEEVLRQHLQQLQAGQAPQMDPQELQMQMLLHQAQQQMLSAQAEPGRSRGRSRSRSRRRSPRGRSSR